MICECSNCSRRSHWSFILLPSIIHSMWIVLCSAFNSSKNFRRISWARPWTWNTWRTAGAHPPSFRTSKWRATTQTRFAETARTRHCRAYRSVHCTKAVFRIRWIRKYRPPGSKSVNLNCGFVRDIRIITVPTILSKIEKNFRKEFSILWSIFNDLVPTGYLVPTGIWQLTFWNGQVGSGYVNIWPPRSGSGPDP